MEITISAMLGSGSVSHNARSFSAKNVDVTRTQYNVEFCNEDIKTVYHQLFDDALERYNAKQTRNDRKIDNYYEKIRQGKQEKLFHEVIFQVGNKDDMNARSENGQIAKEILTEFMNDFQQRNPNLHVFSAHLHMDEETPHIHIDFVPFISGSKRGLDTRVTLKGALAAQGFSGGTRGATEWNQWVEAEKKVLAQVMERHDIKWLQKGTHNKHLSVLDFEKQEREKEVAKLDERIGQSEMRLAFTTKMADQQFARVEELSDAGEKIQERNETLKSDNEELTRAAAVAQQIINEQTAKISSMQSENEKLEQEKKRLQSESRRLEKEQQDLRKDVEKMTGTKTKLERDVRIYDEDEKWQLPEAGVMQTAKSYRDKVALPLVDKLKGLVKNLTIKCIRLTEQVKNLTAKVDDQKKQISRLVGKVMDQSSTIEKMQEKVLDLGRLERYLGREQMQSILEKSKALEQTERADRRLKCSVGISR